MVRMSQDWKIRMPLIDMHGNNGSIDDDPAAAMRYTEARLAKIAGTLLEDIDKDTVLFAPNFDDTENEPTVLPARFPVLDVYKRQGLGFFFTRRYFEKQLKEHPPVNEKMIRAMFLQMGRKPSEAQIRAIMKSMGQ